MALVNNDFLPSDVHERGTGWRLGTVLGYGTLVESLLTSVCSDTRKCQP